jgi:hypothetical protein
LSRYIFFHVWVLNRNLPWETVYFGHLQGFKNSPKKFGPIFSNLSCFSDTKTTFGMFGNFSGGWRWNSQNTQQITLKKRCNLLSRSLDSFIPNEFRSRNEKAPPLPFSSLDQGLLLEGEDTDTLYNFGIPACTSFFKFGKK